MSQVKFEMHTDQQHLIELVAEGDFVERDECDDIVQDELKENAYDGVDELKEEENADRPDANAEHDDSNSLTTGVHEVNSQTQSDLLLIGAGLMRSGTSSLKSALEYLYKKRCYHMRELVFNLRESHILMWLWAIQRDREKKEIPREFWTHIYKDFVAAVDYPTVGFYKHLLQIYPNAKVVLTVRDPEEWVRSCRATTLLEIMYRKPTLGQRIVYRLTGVTKLPELHRQMFRQTLGENFDTATDEQLKNAYIGWNEEVIRSVPAGRLLIFKSTEGWKPLCEFLGLPIPPSELPYPHLNERDVMVQAINRFHLPCRWIDRFFCFSRYLLLPFLFAFIFVRYADEICNRISSMI
ncbi:unnamed protein product [Heterobilharzia americana]|nr:unnamed protein product [Heterobilharzia americana]CAH8619249.1 unnamed protein product [Heterobilharzia americana]